MVSTEASRAPVQVLVVCTGNLCRSPAVVALLQWALAGVDEGDVVVHSAGTRPVADGSMPDLIWHRLQALGVSERPSVGQALSAAAVRSATLVLTAERAHRADVLSFVPSANRRVFTLREFARIAPTVSDALASPAPAPGEGGAEHLGARLARAVDLVASRRGFLPPAAPAELDVVDPYRRPPAVTEQMLAQVVPAVGAIAELLGTSGAGSLGHHQRGQRGRRDVGAS